MTHEKRVIVGRLLFALLVGLTGMIGTLLLLSRGASARLMIEGEHALVISQGQRTDPIQAGAQEVYTLSYRNVTTDAIADVVITNTLDPRVTYITASPRPTGGLPEAPYWSIGSLSPSMHGEIVLTVTVADPLPGGTVLTNIAAIAGQDVPAESSEITTTLVIPTGAEPIPSDDVDAPSPTPTTPPPNEEGQSGTFSDDTTGPAVMNLLDTADVTLTLTKSSNPDPVPSGAPLTYTLSYGNIGDTDATSVTITDVLDSRVTYVSASPEPTRTAPALYWDLGTLISNTTGEIVVSTTVQDGLSEGTTLTNTATIDSQDANPLTVTETTSVLAHGAPVSVTLTPAAATIAAGQSIAYALTAHDAFGNDWTATNSATYTITTGAAGIWATNIYTGEKDGTWTITATYETREDTATLTVTNVAPTAVISGPATGDEGETLTFDASLSQDPGNDIDSYEWDWDYDATFSADASGATATHEYTDDGTYTVALRVTDDNEVNDIDTATITIANVAPVVDAGSDQTVDEATIASFNGSFTDPGVDTHSIEWDFGDGASATGTLAPTHVYNEPGSFNVTLTVTDDDGGVGSDELTVTVDNLAPTVDAGGSYAGTAGTPVSLSASGSDPGGGPVTYAWDLDGDGQYDDATGANASFTSIVSGTHTVAVRVTDSQLAEDTDTAQVFISPAELHHIVLSPSTSEIQAGGTQPYTVEAFDEYDNSRGNVTTESDFIIAESGDGGTWVDNVYTSANYGDWTVRATYIGTIVATDTASLLVLSPDLHIEKSANLESVEAGAYLTYTLTYSNTGNQAADGLVITDTLDPNVDYVVDSASPLPSDYDNDGLYWHLTPLDPGESDQITLSVQVHRPLPNQTILTNTAWIDSLQTAPLPTTHQTTVTSRPVLTITKRSYPDVVEPGGIIRYTIIITNTGNENATPVTVTEYYDPYVSFFSSEPPPSDAGSGDRTWVFPTLDADGHETIDIFARAADVIPSGTVLTNQVMLESDQTTPVTATETTSVTSAAEFTFYKLDLSDPVDAGTELEYIIHYGNYGSSPAYDVVVTETYDSLVTFVSAIPAPQPGTENVWRLSEVDVGEASDIRVRVRVNTPLPNETILTNRATIDSRYTSPRTTVETTTVSSAPGLTFSVTDDPDPVEAGDPLTYTLRYTNTGNADATGVVITATFDSNVTFIDSDPLDPTPGGSDQVQVWDVGTIPGEGGTGQIVVHTGVTLPLTNGTKLDFTVQLEDTEGDFLERTARTTVRSAPILSLDKNNGVSSVEAGDRLTYTLAYDNSGNENAYDVIITDTLPSYVEYIGCEGCEPPGGDPEAVVFHVPAISQTSGQVRLFVQVDDPLPAGAYVLENTARMTHRSLPDPIFASDVDDIDTRPDLTIAGSHTPSLFAPGRLMTYTLTYGNAVSSQMHAEGANIKTTLPNGTEYVGDGWNSSDGQTYVFQIGELLAGSVGHTITFTVRHTDTPEISQPEFLTPFTIAQNGDVAEDANPDNNTYYDYIGVPDIVVKEFTVEPIKDRLPPDVPITFTVVLKNQGTGWAWNPDVYGGFFVDIFLTHIPSYPFIHYSDIYTTVNPIAPGAERTIVLTHTGFSEQAIREDIDAFYAKVDNYADPPEGEHKPWTRLWGLVPEYNEWNNVSDPVSLGIEYIYLPLVVKQVGS